MTDRDRGTNWGAKLCQIVALRDRLEQLGLTMDFRISVTEWLRDLTTGSVVPSSVSIACSVVSTALELRDSVRLTTALETLLDTLHPLVQREADATHEQRNQNLRPRYDLLMRQARHSLALQLQSQSQYLLAEPFYVRVNLNLLLQETAAKDVLELLETTLNFLDTATASVIAHELEDTTSTDRAGWTWTIGQQLWADLAAYASGDVMFHAGGPPDNMTL